MSQINDLRLRRFCIHDSERRLEQTHFVSDASLSRNRLDPAVLGSLGRESLANAVFLALTTARMRVLPGWVEPVVRLIGADRAAQCSSLPASARRR